MTHGEQAPLELCVGHHQDILTTEDLHLDNNHQAPIQTREVHHLAISRTVDHLQVIRAKSQEHHQIQACLVTQIL